MSVLFAHLAANDCRRPAWLLGLMAAAHADEVPGAQCRPAQRARHPARAAQMDRSRRLGRRRSCRRLCGLPHQLQAVPAPAQAAAGRAADLSSRCGRSAGAPAPPATSRPTRTRRARSSRTISARCGSPSSARSTGLLTGYYEPIVRRLALPKPGILRAALPPSARPGGRRASKTANAAVFPNRATVGRLNDKKRARALLRPRRHRGRRARRPAPRNLLARGRLGRHDDPDPGLGARAARRRHDAARQLRCPQRLRLYGGRPHPDRAQSRAARRNVDGPHPPLDGRQSGPGQGGALDQPLLRVLPHHRPQRRRARRWARRACR